MKLIFTKKFIINLDKLEALEIFPQVLIINTDKSEYNFSTKDIGKVIEEIVLFIQNPVEKEKHLEKYELDTEDQVVPDKVEDVKTGIFKRRGRPPKKDIL